MLCLYNEKSSEHTILCHISDFLTVALIVLCQTLCASTLNCVRFHLEFNSRAFRPCRPCGLSFIMATGTAKLRQYSDYLRARVSNGIYVLTCADATTTTSRFVVQTELCEKMGACMCNINRDLFNGQPQNRFSIESKDALRASNEPSIIITPRKHLCA